MKSLKSPFLDMACFCVLFSGAVVARPASAQQIDNLKVGARLRVELASTGPATQKNQRQFLIGTVSQSSRTSLELQTGVSDTISIPVHAILGLAESAGTSRLESSLRLSALCGAFSLFALSTTNATRRSVGISSLSFALAGALTGISFPRERWRSVRLKP